MNVTNMKPISQIARQIDLAEGKIVDLKMELARQLLAAASLEVTDYAKEIDRVIDKAQAEVAEEYEFTSQAPRNFWLGIKSIFRVQYIALVQPDLMVEQKIKGKTVKEPITQVAEKGVKAMTQAGKSINQALGNTDGRSKKRGTQNNAGQLPPVESKVTAFNANSKESWEREIVKASNAQRGNELIQALLSKWDFVQSMAKKAGFTMTLTPIAKEVTALPKVPRVDAIQHAPAKAKKHQPQPLTH
jgi:hypothetical protein